MIDFFLEWEKMNYAVKIGWIRRLFVMFLLTAGIATIYYWIYLWPRFFPIQNFFLCASTVVLAVAVYIFCRKLLLRTWIVQCPICGLKSATLKCIGDVEFLVCDQCGHREETGWTLGPGASDV